jgi:phosphatidylglycerophosphate synthase
MSSPDCAMTGLWWRLPDAPLRSSVARAAAAAATATFALGLGTQWWIGASPTGSVLALGLVVTITIVIAGRLRDFHPFPRFGAANLVTLLRVGVVAVTATLLAEPDLPPAAWAAVAMTAVAVILDGWDGWLARRSRMASAFGARFDMETDAALILILSVLVWQHGKAGWWVSGCGLLRYAFVASGWLLPWMAAPLRSTIRGKTVAVLQLVGLGAVLLPLVSPPLSEMLAAATLGALVWSFSLDILWLRRTAS